MKTFVFLKPVRTTTDHPTVRFAEKGVGSESESLPITDRFTVVEHSVCLTKRPSSKLIAKKYPDARSTLVWRYWSLRQALSQIRDVSRGFLGVYHGFNFPECLLADLGAIYAGALAVGMYSTSNRAE